VLKHSAAIAKINVLTTNRTTTHRHNDELTNMFFKNNPGKIASLKNYNESHYDITDDNNVSKNKLYLFYFSAFCGVIY